MLLLALANEVVANTENAAVANTSSNFDIISIIESVGDISAIGLAALSIILIFVGFKYNLFTRQTVEAVKEKMSDKSESESKTGTKIKDSGIEEIKPILTNLVLSLQKISGNDLSHIQTAVDNLGATVMRIETRVTSLEDKIETHDKQALNILNKVESSEKCMEELKRLLTRSAV